MTADRYARLRECVEKATPGEWRVFEQEIADKEQAKRELCELVDGTPDFQPVMAYVTDDDFDLAAAVTGCGKRSKDNAAYIAAASPATIAALLAEHDRLLIENRNLRATIGWAANMTAAGNRKVNPAGDLLDNLNITLRAALSAGEAIGFVTHETKE